MSKSVSRIAITPGEPAGIGPELLIRLAQQPRLAAWVAVADAGLLDNAIEATDPPGLVTVSASRRNGSLEILVSDTGRGVPEEAKQKLFLPHFSTKGRGTGLGLAIVHRIVSEHHGTIQAGDNLPHGTIFTISLPLQ